MAQFTLHRALIRSCGGVIQVSIAYRDYNTPTLIFTEQLVDLSSTGPKTDFKAVSFLLFRATLDVTYATLIPWFVLLIEQYVRAIKLSLSIRLISVVLGESVIPNELICDGLHIAA